MRVVEEKTRRRARPDFWGCGWGPFVASIVPASGRPVDKSHRPGIGVRGARCGISVVTGQDDETKRWVVDPSLFRVKGDANRGENMQGVRTLMGARNETWSA